MAKAKSTTVVDKWKAKKWYKLIAPKVFNEQVIGETAALSPNILIGRTASINLFLLTRDIKKQNINIVFEITKVQGDNAYTKVKKYEMDNASIKRLVRKGKSRIDDSFVCETADKNKVKVKPLFIPISVVKKSIATSLRKAAREFFLSNISKCNSDLLVQNVVNHKMQDDVKNVLNKIYPLKVCEIRMLAFEKKGAKEEGKAEEKESVEIKSQEAKSEKISEEIGQQSLKASNIIKADDTKEKRKESEEKKGPKKAIKESSAKEEKAAEKY
ncbi:MAG: hypothetical protein N3D84_03955 [Candidatus Woesearchaeota archaeon]|nr:hypothetical protein [Candidatus Woesearchaeota archaeon]